MKKLLIALSMVLIVGCGEKVCYSHQGWSQTQNGMVAIAVPEQCSSQFHDRNWYLAMDTSGALQDEYYLSIADSDSLVTLNGADWVLGTTLEVENNQSIEFYGRFYTCMGCNETVGSRPCVEPLTIDDNRGGTQTLCSASIAFDDGPAAIE